MNAPRTVKVVAIGHVPPPVTGQSMMFRMLADARFRSVEISHVPMVLSKEVGDMGNFGFGKIGRLLPIPFKAVAQRFRTGANVLYYMPSGPVKLAVLRDMFVLLLTRPFFSYTVFHFHAGGLSELYPTLPRPVQKLYRRALGSPDVIVRISPSAPSELEHLQGRQEVLVPNGIPDPAPAGFVRVQKDNGPYRLLFVGHLLEGKGILVLLEALQLLVAAGEDVSLTCVGAWPNDALRDRALDLVRGHGLSARVHFTGALQGDAKWECFQAADVFVFPSFFHSEVFPLVLLEAMAYSLPIVATSWRGIPDVVRDGTNALLVPTKDAAACAEAIATLLADASLRARFGKAARERYLELFSKEAHLAAMEKVFLTASQGQDVRADHAGAMQK